MLNKLITLATILCLFSLQAQNVEWENVYPNRLTLGKALTIDSDNNIISIGNGFPTGGYNEYVYIQKYTPQGNLIWKDSISTTLNNNYHSATWVGTDSNKDIFVVGYRFTLSSQNQIPNAIKVFKISSGGTVLQNKTITGVFNRDGNFNLGRRNEAALDESGNLYVATAGSTDSQTNAGFVLLKFDNNANLLWERVHTFTNVHGLRGMHYNNGKIALVGTTTIAGNNNQVAVWDALGNLAWASTGTIPDQTWATDVLLDNAGNTYTLCQNFGSTHELIEVTKYSPSGSVLFSEPFDLGVAATSGRMALLPNGNIAISGTNWTISGTGKLFVAKLDASDASIVTSSLHDLPQINNWVYDLTTTPNENYYVAGQSDNNGGAPSSMFIYAFSDTNGYEWNTSYNSEGVKPMTIMADSNENIYFQVDNNNTVVKLGNSITLSQNEVLPKNKIKLYPNPIDKETTLEFELQNATKSQITIYNELGDIMLVIPKTDLKNGLNKINLNLSQFQSGLYFCHIFDGQKNHIFKLLKK